MRYTSNRPGYIWTCACNKLFHTMVCLPHSAPKNSHRNFPYRILYWRNSTGTFHNTSHRFGQVFDLNSVTKSPIVYYGMPNFMRNRLSVQLTILNILWVGNKNQLCLSRCSRMKLSNELPCFCKAFWCRYIHSLGNQIFLRLYPYSFEIFDYISALAAGFFALQ